MKKYGNEELVSDFLCFHLEFCLKSTKSKNVNYYLYLGKVFQCIHRNWAALALVLLVSGLNTGLDYKSGSKKSENGIIFILYVY